MAYKTLLFGVDDIFNELKPYYEQAIKRGMLEVAALAVIEPKAVRLTTPDGKSCGVERLHNLQLAIISSRRDFYRRMKYLEAHGIPRNRIIDGRVFKVPNLDFPRLLAEGVAYGIVGKQPFIANNYSIYPQMYKFQTNDCLLMLGKKSYIERGNKEGVGIISVGNFSSIALETFFNLGHVADHNYHNVSAYALTHLDWDFPKEFLPPQGTCKVSIGNDVWIGRGCNLRTSVHKG